MEQEVMIIDFGGQYNQLIARRVRDLHVYCEVVPYKKVDQYLEKHTPQGIIFTGGPNSVYVDDAPKIDPKIYDLGIPILGLCYGMQRMAVDLGGQVSRSDRKSVV